ncbi:NUDIX domain-containing protein [bacterium]|nr:NUDIX domain-containing protein [bacterium]NUN45852.1 NUDIX domain-containing protein [bacterium]
MPEILCRVIDCHVFRQTQEGPRYLVMQRANEVIYAGSWRMVGGKIENGEKAWETALRELSEETGLTAMRLWAVPYINSFYEASKDRVNIIPVFAACVQNDTVTLSREHNAYRWASYDEALTLLPWPAQIEGLRIVHEYITTGKTVAGFVEIPLRA